MRTVHVVSGPEPFRQTISVGSHTLVADEPVDVGGGDEGPDPHEFLLSSLGACTAITLRMYARRKGWPLDKISVQVSAKKGEDGAFEIDRKIALEGVLTEEQQTQLRAIAEKCPVHKTLLGEIRIATALMPAPTAAPTSGA